MKHWWIRLVCATTVLYNEKIITELMLSIPLVR